MKIDVLTIFPEMFTPVLNESIIKRAQEKEAVKIEICDLRDFSSDKHNKVDDRPFGGGPGMVLKPEPIFAAVEAIEAVRPLTPRLQGADSPLSAVHGFSGEKSCKRNSCTKAKQGRRNTKTKIILLSPQGKRLDHNLVKKISKFKHLILICGHYEGVDERVRKFLVDEEVSIGDYILTGGELPAMVLIDSIVRLIPGVLGNQDSNKQETFSGNLLKYPQYTRPALYREMEVPEILLSGNHKQIQEWRKKESVRKTVKSRPDLRKPLRASWE